MKNENNLFRLLLLAMLGALIISGLGACQDDDDDHASIDDDDDNDDSKPCEEKLILIDQEPILMINNLLGVSVNTAFSREVEAFVEYGEGQELTHTSNTKLMPANTTTSIDVYGLKPSTTYSMRVATTAGDCGSVWGDAVEIKTGSWPANWPTFDAVDYTDGRGYSDLGWNDDEVFCFNQAIGSADFLYVCVDRQGTPRWYYTINKPAAGGWILLVSQAFPGGTFGFNSGEIGFVGIDGSLLYDSPYTGADLVAMGLQQGLSSFHHEILPITKGEYAGSAAVLTNSYENVDWDADPLTPDEKVNTGGIAVFNYKNGTIPWQWSHHGIAGDDQPVSPDKLPYGYWGLSPEVIWGSKPDNYVYDWTHMNALVHGLNDDDSEFFWISIRHVDMIAKLDIAGGDFEWVLGRGGDFRLVDDIDSANPQDISDDFWFYHQHSPEIISQNGSRIQFLVFDNGNYRPEYLSQNEAYSRVVLYEIDEDLKLAEVVFDFGTRKDQPDSFYAWGMSDANLMPDGDSILFAKGSYDSPNTPNTFLAEINYDDQPAEIQWKLTPVSGEGSYDSYDRIIYRVDYFPNIKDRDWKFSAKP